LLALLTTSALPIYADASEFSGIYSLQVYQQAVVDIIDAQDTDRPLFVYAALQNVHAPLADLPDNWFSTSEHEQLENLMGNSRREYAKALIMLDRFVGVIKKTLSAKGILDNTYIIFRQAFASVFLLMTSIFL
jgi:arylsulfatase A-like enzyme